MAAAPTLMIPNRPGRWSSVVYILIGLAGTYGLLTDLAWPPTRMEGVLAVSVVAMAAVAVRSLRSGVLVDAHGLISRADVRTRRLAWTDFVGFEARGSLFANHVGAVLVDGRWLALQYHPYADDYVKQLQQARLTYASKAHLQAAAEFAARHAALPTQRGRRRFLTWRFALGVVVYVAFVALVVRLEIMPLGVVLMITAVVVIMNVWQAWSTRRGRS